MKILHTADLHIGKVVNGYSMLEDQAFALESILFIIEDLNIDVVLIAGDIYDKRNPTDESVRLFHYFINQLTAFDLDVFIVSGNHDSGVKLEFAQELLSKQNIYVFGSIDEKPHKITLKDKYGPVNFYPIPFIRPGEVRSYQENVMTYHDAYQFLVQRLNVDESERNVLIGHQFFASGQEKTSESEKISVGGLENIGYELIKSFDYAALGHLHRPQKLKYNYIRYSGSILPYSESETTDIKSVVIIDFMEKGDTKITKIPIKHQRKFVKIEGYLSELLRFEKSYDYIFVTLKDEFVIDAMSKLRAIFPNIMGLSFDNKRTSKNLLIDVDESLEKRPIKDMFMDFYQLQNNMAVSDYQESVIEKVLEGIDEDATT